MEENIQYMQIVKATKGKRPSIFIPKLIVESLDLENTYVKFVLYKNELLDIRLTDEFGNEKVNQVKPHDELKEKITQNQNELYSLQLETKDSINRKLDKVIEHILTIKNNSNDLPSLLETSINENEPEEEIELIDIKPKDMLDFKYIFRYIEQDQEHYERIREALGDNPELDTKEPTQYCGLNMIRWYGGNPAVKLDAPCDWESTFKGGQIVPTMTYFEPRLYTYIKDEYGAEKRVPYDDIEPYESQALYEFITISGKKYQLDSNEIWFDPYDFESRFLTIEEILSKEFYQEFLDKKIDNHMRETQEYARNLI